MNTIIIGLLLALPFPVNAQVKEIKLEEKVPLTIPEMIVKFSEKYNVNEDIINTVIKCESGFNPNAVNMADSHKLSQGSHGIAQFSRETFKYYSEQIGILNGDPYNPEQAIETMAYMLSIGQGNHWTCFRKFYKDL